MTAVHQWHLPQKDIIEGKEKDSSCYMGVQQPTTTP